MFFCLVCHHSRCRVARGHYEERLPRRNLRRSTLRVVLGADRLIGEAVEIVIVCNERTMLLISPNCRACCWAIRELSSLKSRLISAASSAFFSRALAAA